MKIALQRVVVAGTGAFLPNDPVPNSELERILGDIPDAPKRVRTFIQNMGPRMLESGGVESRHFAIDPESHRLTHTVVTLAEPAARRAIEAASCRPGDVELLLLAAPNYEFSTPPTSALLQERLGIPICAEMEIHSNCSGVGKAVQIAFDSLRVGRYRTALVVYSQLSSVYIRSSYFQQSKMNKTQAALRYILADGAGAVFLKAVDAVEDRPLPHEVLGAYVESIGADRPPGMTAGGGVADLVDPDCQIPGIFEQGRHHLDQDFAAVGRDAVPVLVQGAKRMLAKLEIEPSLVSHYIYSTPGRQLYDSNIDQVTGPFGVTADQVRFRACRTGYCGGASILLHFDEMVRSGELQSGQMAVLYSVESSKWMSGGFVVRW